MGSDPPSSTTRPGSISLTWPIRTTSSIRRSCSSSACDTMAQRYISGSIDSSIRSRHPAAASRVKRSSTDSANSTDFSCAETSASTCLANCRPGWMPARFSSQASRGLIQVSRCGAMPWRNSHRQVSMAVLPAPTITYRSRASHLGRSFGGMQSTSGCDVVGRWPHRRHGDTHKGRVDDPRRAVT